MGPYGSTIHDYVEAQPGSKCVAYDPEDCEMHSEAPTVRKKHSPPPEETDLPPGGPILPPEGPVSGGPDSASINGLDAYLKAMNEP